MPPNNQGRPLGGKPPFGYMSLGGRLVPDPDTAPLRRLIYDLFIEHKRQHVVAKILNERGYRTSTGSKFTRQTVERNIRDTTAKGLHQRSAVPPIVPVEVWGEANAILDQQRTAKSNIGRPAKHLFSGIVRCHCGGRMYVPTNNLRYRCQKCANSILATDLEAIYRTQLGEIASTWDSVLDEQKRGIVQHLTFGITVGDDDISIKMFPKT